MKAIIVDDIQLDVELIRKILQAECPDIRIVGEANTLPEAERLIRDMKPELVFLDIQMDRDGATSFQLLDKIGKEHIDFEIIFVTAFGIADYQTKAMQFSGLDFILKPVDAERLKLAVQKARDRKGAGLYPRQIELMLDILKQADRANARLVIERVGGHSEISQIGDIVKCVADGQITQIYFHDGRKIHANKHLGFYESLLSENQFFRISNDTLVNMNFIKSLDHKEATLRMANGDVILASRRRWQGFNKIIKENRNRLPHLAGDGILDMMKRILGM